VIDTLYGPFRSAPWAMVPLITPVFWSMDSPSGKLSAEKITWFLAELSANTGKKIVSPFAFMASSGTYSDITGPTIHSKVTVLLTEGLFASLAVMVTRKGEFAEAAQLIVP
jgi:hypothetical protein